MLSWVDTSCPFCCSCPIFILFFSLVNIPKSQPSFSPTPLSPSFKLKLWPLLKFKFSSSSKSNSPFKSNSSKSFCLSSSQTRPIFFFFSAIVKFYIHFQNHSSEVHLSWNFSVNSAFACHFKISKECWAPLQVFIFGLCGRTVIKLFCHSVCDLPASALPICCPIAASVTNQLTHRIV